MSQSFLLGDDLLVNRVVYGAMPCALIHQVHHLPTAARVPTTQLDGLDGQPCEPQIGSGDRYPSSSYVKLGESREPFWTPQFTMFLTMNSV